jgi:hypothetical protein
MEWSKAIVHLLWCSWRGHKRATNGDGFYVCARCGIALNRAGMPL